MARPTEPVTGRFVSMPLLDRLADRIDFDDCWLWRGRSNRGYGRVSTGQVNGRPDLRPVHRVLWELLVGPVPAGMELDHLCMNGMCVNPDHLEPVTHQENVRRSNNAAAVNARKTHCVNGHELAGDNVYSPPKRPDRRYCRTCQTKRSRPEARPHEEVV